MRLHPEANELLRKLRAAGVPRFSELTPQAARQAMLERQRNLPGEPPEVARVAELELPGPSGTLAARSYVPSEERPAGTIVYFHGGGWVVGGLEEFDRVARALALASRCEVVSVDYRLAPEHPFPAALEDADAALRWADEARAGEGALVVMGDSSGGTLAALTAIRARDRGGPPLALQALVYPVVDHAMDTPSYEEHADAFPLGRADMEWFLAHYAPAGVDRDSPELSPLRTPDLSGLPPALILVAGHDPTRDHSLAYAERLEHAGVPVELRRYDDMMHGFFTMAGVLARADSAMAAVGERIRAAIEAAAMRG
jgi:acetyl esterase